MKHQCSHLSLDAITKMIEDHDVFKKGKRGPIQMPVKYQLMVFSNFIGHESTTDKAQQNTFLIGRGTTQLYQKHVIIALVSLKNQFIKWPDENE